MVASFNKWSVPVLTLFCLTLVHRSTGVVAVPKVKNYHPFHVSTTEINHNAADKSLEISCRIFLDDFESCLSKVYQTKADLTSSTAKPAMDSLIKKYIGSHLSIKVDSKAGTLRYIGSEKQDESTYAYFEIDNISTVKKVEITNSILYDLYDDQVGIVHVIVGGNRKTSKLEYPNKELSVDF